MSVNQRRGSGLADRRYRPGIERTLFALALLGVLLAVHLVLWYDGGEVAAQEPLCGGGFDCEAVLDADPMPLGISSTIWGLLFYLALVAAGMGIVLGKAANILRPLRLVMVGTGWLYSLFLTIYQFFFLSDKCLLCLLSAGLVTVMVLVLGFAWWKSSDSTMLSPGEWRLYAAMVGVLLVVLGADYYYSRQTEGTEVAQGLAATEEEVVDPALCQINSDVPYFENIDALVTPEDVVLGNRDAEVIVMEFLDPNCNHCKTFHPVMKRLVEKYHDRVRFVLKPVTLVGGPTHSMDEVMALWLADEQGYLEGMLDMVFEYQSPATGLSVESLVDFAEDLGMDEDQFKDDLVDGRMRDRALRTFRVYQGMNLRGVPSILVGGTLIASSTRDVGCLSHFIERELARVSTDQPQQ